ncbi:putative transposase-like DNA-binding protein [Nonomuraea polychroma]|uniref:Putative transposase-like DNA-binding protein n=1 Tax=Nonomuraea polychroma TaxID=46176 RepID=A0A438M3H3_9ACTN|nr:zinc ribbon domain-containing protein [Nonomuraea polychroma]RVX40390.1 putative transposase-like DNA-binding protein [Nonomuraea polychroma]
MFYLAAKRKHQERLLAGFTPADPRFAELAPAYEVIGVEHERVCARIRNLNKALAWSAARWALDHALAAGATVIYLEDLATLEARGRRGRANARLSGQVRGQVVAAIRHLAAKHGIAVVTVPARGNSRYCPRCGTGTSIQRHCPAPDRLTERGWAWAHCPACGLSCDRDWAAAERILARGLLGQQATRTDRTAGPTPKRHTRTPKNPSMASSRVPDRRTVPAPPPNRGGQRPAGQAPQTTRPPAGRTGLARDPHHRTGFHRVAATPVLPLGQYAGSPPRPRPPDLPEILRSTQRIADAPTPSRRRGGPTRRSA